jgi:hypothetical protein
MAEPPEEGPHHSHTSPRGRPGKLTMWLIWIVSLVFLFFLIGTLVQLFSLQRRMGEVPEMRMSNSENDVAKAAIALEVHSVERRFHLAEVVLMSHLWVVYLGFVTGMILALVGSAFIVAKIREAQTVASGKTAIGELNLTSTSPGLIMTILGTALMMATILTPQTGSVNEGPLYLSGAAQILAPAKAPPSDAAKALWQSLSNAQNPAARGNSNGSAASTPNITKP